MSETRERLILDLLQRYKEKFLNVSLAAPYKEGERADELYKWQLITKCHNKTDVEIIRNFKSKNVVHVQTVYPVLTELLKNNQQQLVDCFNGLKDENRSLSERLSIFKKEMENLCSDKFKSKANDERTAAAFLTCWNPEKYTFFINTKIYRPYCNYIGEQPYETGEKYPHYLQLIAELAEIIKQDPELIDKFQNETKGLVQSDLLTAQNILWQMKDMMSIETASDGFSFKEFSNAISLLLNNNESFSINRKRKNFIWVNSKCFEATDEYHYEFCADNTKNANHDGKHVFVEVHFESPNHSFFKNALTNINGLASFKWSNFGVRINDNGLEMKGDVSDVANKALNELYDLDLLVGKTIIQTITKLKMNNEITNILRIKKNIILQGAPGTGKTYNTAAMALSICGETIPEKHEDVMKRYVELQKEGRIGFCTFHQSMDYEDFIEGIKPKTENGYVSYNYEDGVFKKMVVCSEYAFVDNQKKSIVTFKNFDERWNCLIDSINETNSYEFETKKTKMTVLEVTDNSIKLQGESAEKATTCYKSEIEKLWNVFGESNLEEIKNFNTEFRKYVGGNETAKYAILKALQNEEIDIGNYYAQEDDELDYDKKKELVSKLNGEDFKTVPDKNYVLIIDEINRGNVSKIFGELITLLEADKRLGGDHPIKVMLPYSKESFGVPSNLYIIGTMNTTDRSVGTIDYAVRRRFAFVTLKADRQILVGKYGEDSKQVLLFDAIYTFLDDDKKHPDMDIDDLMVGHSYFMADDDNELKLKLEYEIIPLIREYNKDGIVNVKKDDLEKAFNDWKAAV